MLECIEPLIEYQEMFRHPTYGIELTFPFQFYAAELASSDVAMQIDADEWSIRDRLVLFREMVKVVRRVHNHGIMHRDLKPSNFLIASDGRLLISDFGTARDILSPIRSAYANPPGDLTYCPLEMIASLHDIDPRFGFLADHYALGAVLFELFTGTPLNIQLFTADMFDTLNQAMSAIDKADRNRIYDATISAISNKYMLPAIEDFNGNVPGPIRNGVNRLYRSLAALDYRIRLTDWTSIYHLIDRCIFILDNEEAYRRWKQRRELFKAAAEAKRKRVTAKRVGLAK